MREILFRGKDAEDGEWRYGYYIKRNDGDRGHLILEDYWTESYEVVVPETIGLYTGLIDDKIGRRIFEGDIVKVNDTYTKASFIGVVKFGNGSFYIGDSDSNSHYRLRDFDLEVIGNIYDNPELMEATK